MPKVHKPCFRNKSCLNFILCHHWLCQITMNDHRSTQHMPRLTIMKIFGERSKAQRHLSCGFHRFHILNIFVALQFFAVRHDIRM